jgi:hypothetical protein
MFQEGCAIIFLNWLVWHVRCYAGPVTGFCRSVIADLHLCTIWTSVQGKRCMLIHAVLHDNVCFAYYPEI